MQADDQSEDRIDPEQPVWGQLLWLVDALIWETFSFNGTLHLCESIWKQQFRKMYDVPINRTELCEGLKPALKTWAFNDSVTRQTLPFSSIMGSVWFASSRLCYHISLHCGLN